MENSIDKNFIEKLLLQRNKFAHKGDFGRTLLICGSELMVGAAFLATGGALRSGCGYVHTLLPQKYVAALAARFPSALAVCEEKNYFSQIPEDLERFSSIGIGCGLGKHKDTVFALENLLKNYNKPMVIDADALNIISQNTDLLDYIPENSILTPHLKELERLIGTWQDDEEKLNLTSNFAEKYSVIVLVKGYNTMICLPNKKRFFNTTGNAFLAKAGSGDVLTGLIAGMLARGYKPFEAAAIGAYYHGLAGEMAEQAISGESYNSADLIDFIRI
jgi:NAD(P)H-hydrate epimerase